MDREREEQLGALAQTLGQLMWQGHKQTVNSIERLALTLPQVAVLFGLEAGEGRATMRDLVHLTQQSAATLTGIVDRLIGAGLVERQRDEQDRRVVRVYITPAGRSQLAAVNRQREADLAELTAAFTVEEIEHLDALLRKLMQGVEKMLTQSGG